MLVHKFVSLVWSRKWSNLKLDFITFIVHLINKLGSCFLNYKQRTGGTQGVSSRVKRVRCRQTPPSKREGGGDTGHTHPNPMLRPKREKYHALSVQNTAMYTTFRMAIW